jgi:hypothetical protein
VSLTNGQEIIRVARFFLVQLTKTVKCTEMPINIPTSSIETPSKVYPNWYFWFENKPSGNPGRNHKNRTDFLESKLISSLKASLNRRVANAWPYYFNVYVCIEVLP